MKNKRKVYQIGFLTALIISVGATTGAGIFFKNESILRDSGGSLVISIMAWIMSAFGMLMIGLALVQLTSNDRKSNGGVLSWTKDYAAKWVHKISRGFMFWIYLPTTYIALPMYTTMTIQNTFNVSFEWYWFVLISFSIVLLITTLNKISLRIGSIMQYIFITINSIPIILTVVTGFMHFNENDNYAPIKQSITNDHFSAYAPGLGLIASVPAIFFAYDGFYTASSLKSDLKDVKKNLPRIMAFSVIVITLIYLSVAGALLTSSSTGTFQNMNVDKVTKKIIGIGILLATLGIINGFSIIAPKIYQEFLDSEEIVIHKFIKKLFHKNQGWWTAQLITIGFYAIFVPIGAFAYYDASGYLSSPEHYLYTKETASLLSMMDLLTNWTSLIIFIIIGAAIFGALVNLHKNKIKCLWYFKTTAIISLLFISIGTVYIIGDTIFSLIYSIQHNLDYKGPLTRLIVLVITMVVSWLVDFKIKASHQTSIHLHHNFHRLNQENKNARFHD